MSGLVCLGRKVQETTTRVKNWANQITIHINKITTRNNHLLRMNEKKSKSLKISFEGKKVGWKTSA